MKVTNDTARTHFYGRCTQIKDAQWVCHAVTTNFPHFSTTKFKPLFQKTIDRYPQFIDTSSDLKTLPDIAKAITSLEIFKPFAHILNEDEQKHMNLLLAIKNKILQMGKVRNKNNTEYKNCSIENIIKQLQDAKMANCFELARLAELILRINNVSDTYIGKLTLENTAINHTVCLVNPNKNPTKNKLIVIDPWAGIADFADNIKWIYKQIFNITPKEHLEYDIFQTNNYKTIMLDEVKTKYPQLIFNSNSHKFME